MENIKSTVAKLNCGNTQGTAFLISKNFALTMSHCVQEAIDDNEKIYLSFKNISGEDEIEKGFFEAVEFAKKILYKTTKKFVDSYENYRMIKNELKKQKKEEK